MYTPRIKDLANNKEFNGYLEISENGETCTYSTNSIPNHDVNDKGEFVNAIEEVNESLRFAKPNVASVSTALTLQYDNAVFLNGAKLDLLPAACYGVGDQPLGEEKSLL